MLRSDANTCMSGTAAWVDSLLHGLLLLQPLLLQPLLLQPLLLQPAAAAGAGELRLGTFYATPIGPNSLWRHW